MRKRIVATILAAAVALSTSACDPLAPPGPGEQVNVMDGDADRSAVLWRSASYAGLAFPAGARTVAAAVESRGFTVSHSYVHAVIGLAELDAFLRDSDLTMPGAPADSLTLRPWYGAGENGQLVLAGPAYRLSKGTRDGLNYGESLKVYLRTSAESVDVYYFLSR